MSRENTSVSIVPLAFALDGVDTYNVDNMEQAGKLYFYYYVSLQPLLLFQAQKY